MKSALRLIFAATVVSCPLSGIWAEPGTVAVFQAVPSQGMEQFVKYVQEAIEETRDSKQGDKLAALLEKLRIPNPEKWFPDTFGTESGSALLAKYIEVLPVDEKRLVDFFSSHAPPGGTAISDAISEAAVPQEPQYLQEFDAALLKTVKRSTPFYRLQYVWKNSGSGNPVKYTIGFLALVEGRYYLISDSVLRELPGMPPLRIRQGGSVTAAMLQNRVQPVYPIEARKTGLTGTVRLHAIIGRDGHVQNLEVISGETILVDAALEAVRYWRYRPTLLDGKPVEVDTTIDVVFSLTR